MMEFRLDDSTVYHTLKTDEYNDGEWMDRHCGQKLW